MKAKNTAGAWIPRLGLGSLAIALLSLVLAGAVSAKSLYVISSHHAMQFDAWNINPGGTVSLQGTYALQWANAPGGVAVHEPTGTLFISSESGVLEWVDNNFNPIAWSRVVQFAGLAVDDASNVLYAMQRSGKNLYAFDFDPVAKTLTLKSGFPKNLAALYNNSGMGIALDELSSPPVLWVADCGNMMVRAYDTTTWVEDSTLSFSTAPTGRGAIGIGIDRRRGVVCWGSMHMGAYTPPNAGSSDLYKFDLTTRTLTRQSIVTSQSSGRTQEVVDVSVDEDTGLVYITETAGLSVWDVSAASWTRLQHHSFGTYPATCGLAVTNVSFMPDLAIEKVDDLPDGSCVGVGGPVQYTMSYENTGDTGLTGVTLVDDLPAEVDFVSATGGGVYDSTAHTVNWALGDLTVGGLGSVALDVVVNATAVPGSTIINYATIESNETSVTTVQEDTDICTNQPPDCSDAFASIETIWPPNHKWVPVEILGVTDPDGDPVTITITDISQDEPVDTVGDGRFTPDGAGVDTDTAWVRAERSGVPALPGNGRVYHISFTADDGQGGSCGNVVQVAVPHDRAKAATDDGALFDSTATSP